MIIVKLMGGLGNQIFQYAFGQAIEAKIHKKITYDCLWFKEKPSRRLGIFDLGISVKSKRSNSIYLALNKIAIYCSAHSKFIRRYNLPKKIEYLNTIKNNFFYQIVNEKDFSKTEIKKRKNYFFVGYWQNPSYFENVREIILKNINFPKLQNANDLNLQNQIHYTESVAIHVRRGDYVENKNNNEFFGTCSIEYYKKAIDFILSKIPNAKFFIFTDDPDYAKLNFNFLSETILVSDNQRSEIDELNLMHLCKHFIIANSTFSWWGAWLSRNLNKIVITPKQWYKNSEANEKCKIIPKDWMKI